MDTVRAVSVARLRIGIIRGRKYCIATPTARQILLIRSIRFYRGCVLQEGGVCIRISSHDNIIGRADWLKRGVRAIFSMVSCFSSLNALSGGWVVVVGGSIRPPPTEKESPLPILAPFFAPRA